jgi:hypothetical protein
VSWMGSMMVVTNAMVVKCSLLARSPPRIKTRQMAAIQPMTGVMVMCEWSQPPSMVMLEGSARRNGMQSGPTTMVANQMVADMLTCVESAQDQVQTNGCHSTNNRNNGHIQMQFCAPFPAGAICKEKRRVRVLERWWLLTKWSASACLQGIISPELRSPDKQPPFNPQWTTQTHAKTVLYPPTWCWNKVQGNKRSQRGSMMVVANEMAVKCMFARNLPAIKSKQKWLTLNQCHRAWTCGSSLTPPQHHNRQIGQEIRRVRGVQ